MSETQTDSSDKNSHDHWQVANLSTVSRFSAVAYYFAREIHLDTKVPIGIIECARGGPIRFWMSKDSLTGIRKEVIDNDACYTFNSMIKPIIGYGIKGMVGSR